MEPETEFAMTYATVVVSDGVILGPAGVIYFHLLKEELRCFLLLLVLVGLFCFM